MVHTQHSCCSYLHGDNRLMENDLEHNASLSGAVTALRQDELKRMDDVIERTKLEEKV